jgi:hypothetical protein
MSAWIDIDFAARAPHCQLTVSIPLSVGSPIEMTFFLPTQKNEDTLEKMLESA